MFTRNLLLFLFCATTYLSASAEDVPNIFTPGTPANAEEVNANFSALVTQIEALQTQVAALGGGAPTMASVAGTYIVAQLGTSMTGVTPSQGLEKNASIGLFGTSGTVTFVDNGTSTGAGTLNATESQINLFISTFQSSENDPEFTNLSLESLPETFAEDFTWTLSGNSLTLTFPEEDPGEGAEVLTLTLAAGGSIAVAAESFPDDGEVGLIIIVRQ